MSKIIDGLYYSESHEYVKVEGDFGFIGITDYAQHELGNVVYVDMPEVDDEVTAGEEFGAVESNWIIKVELSDKSELDNLMDAAAYKAMIGE